MWTNIWFLAIAPCAAWASMNAPEPLTDSLINFVHKLKPLEDNRQVEFERWCNGSLAAQAQRRDDLHRLLAQAMPMTELGERLPQLSHDIPMLQTQLAKERAAIEALQGALRKSTRDAELAVQDGKKDYNAIKKMQDWLNTRKMPRHTKQLVKMQTRVQKLIIRAQKELEKREAAFVAEKRSNDEAVKKAKAIPILQNKYENAKAEAQKLAQQRLVAQRSTTVLLAALEDESQYLTELRGVCDIRTRLHDRIEAKSFTSLLKIAPQVQALTQRKETDNKVSKEVKEEKVAAPVEFMTTPEPSSVQEQPKVEEPVPKPAKKKRSMRAHHAAPPPKPLPSALPAQGNPPPAPIASKPSTRARKHASPKHAQSQPPAPVAAVSHSEQAPPVNPASPDATPADTAPVDTPPAEASPAVTSPAKKATHHATPAPADEAPADIAPEDTPPVDASPTNKVAHHAASASADTASVDAAPVDAPPVDASPAAQSPAKKAAHHVDPAPADTMPADTAPASVDSEDSAPVPAPVTSHAKKHPTAPKKKKTKHDQFMDSAYAAAAGDLPQAYGAWKPDDEVSSATTKHESVDPSAAVKAMQASFGSDDDSTDMPITSPTPKTATKKVHETEAPVPPPPPPATDPSGVDAAIPAADASAADAAVPSPPPPASTTSDDFDSPSPPPRRRSHRHHRDPAAEDAASTDEAAAAPPPPAPPVPLDNDDLPPPSHLRAPQGLEGGWKAMIGKAKPHKHHKDIDQDIMDKIGSGTPSSYTAWKPDDGSAPAPPPPQEAAPSSQAANDADDGGPLGSAADEAALTGSSPPPSPPPAMRKRHEPPVAQDVEASPAVEAPTPVESQTPAVAAEPETSPAAADVAPQPPPAAADMASGSQTSDADAAPTSSASLLQSSTRGKGKKAAAKKSDAWADMMSGLQSAETDLSKPAPKKATATPVVADGSDASKMMALFSPTPAPAMPVLDDATLANLPPPRIHPIVGAPRGLEGGWQSFIKKGKHKHHKYGDENDLLQNLDAGAPPSTYAAWKPGGAAEAAKSAADAQYAAAMKDFDSFLQTGMEMSTESTVARMLIAAADKQSAKKSPVNLLEKSSSAASQAGESEERISVASLVLDAYSDILASPPLHQLSLSHLDTPQLQSLWDKLQAVDPMTHQKVAGGQKAQAEQWCQYFEKNQQSASQVLKDTQKWEAAESEAAVAASLRTAVMEEKQVREQLLGTLAQDRQVLTGLLQGEEHAFSDTAAQLQKWIQRADKELFSSTGADGLSLHEAAADALNVLTNAQTEMADVLELTIRKRGAVEANQKALLAQVTSEMQKAQSDWQQKKHHEDKAKKTLDKATKKFGDIQKKCDKVLTGMEQRRHGGHREMSAIRTALLVLSDKLE